MGLASNGKGQGKAWSEAAGSFPEPHPSGMGEDPGDHTVPNEAPSHAPRTSFHEGILLKLLYKLEWLTDRTHLFVSPFHGPDAGHVTLL